MLQANVIALLTVVETGSFTKAAEKLSVSKARVSQQVSTLEKTLGAALIHRSTRKIRLTQAGESYYEECRRAANILSSAEQQIKDGQNAYEGLIRINSVGGIFAESLLTPAITEFMLTYPKISIHLDLSSNKVDILTQRFDLVMRVGQLEDSALIGRELIRLRTMIVASPEYLEQNGRPEHPHELSKHRCLCGSIKKWQFLCRDNNKDIEVMVDGHFSAPNGHVICEAARKGLGIARTNELYTTEMLKNGDLVELFTDWNILPQPLSLIYPKARYKTMRMKLFIEFLVDWFGRYKMPIK
ncbi:LysR family transcriptional regulator [Agaribacter marinus]|uniref:LysR family transcriptional regulator n=1 Tax=Agaribacter marinus TaxID=1431249 RepID=A0AA37WHK0_9ALTE|nr:LysR family transcriptional regulator [Agaribacter marinus]GLR71161.1 LysR family transcriptional regulator [Agaribacter marinus]